MRGIIKNVNIIFICISIEGSLAAGCTGPGSCWSVVVSWLGLAAVGSERGWQTSVAGCVLRRAGQTVAAKWRAFVSSNFVTLCIMYTPN